MNDAMKTIFLSDGPRVGQHYEIPTFAREIRQIYGSPYDHYGAQIAVYRPRVANGKPAVNDDGEEIWDSGVSLPTRTPESDGEALTGDVHPAARAAIDPHLYHADAQYHAAADTLTPILEAVGEALASGGHLGPRWVLRRVAHNLLPTADEVERRRREYEEAVRFANRQIKVAYGVPPAIFGDGEEPDPPPEMLWDLPRPFGRCRPPAHGSIDS